METIILQIASYYITSVAKYAITNNNSSRHVHTCDVRAFDSIIVHIEKCIVESVIVVCVSLICMYQLTT